MESADHIVSVWQAKWSQHSVEGLSRIVQRDRATSHHFIGLRQIWAPLVIVRYFLLLFSFHPENSEPEVVLHLVEDGWKSRVGLIKWICLLLPLIVHRIVHSKVLYVVVLITRLYSRTRGPVLVIRIAFLWVASSSISQFPIHSLVGRVSRLRWIVSLVVIITLLVIANISSVLIDDASISHIPGLIHTLIRWSLIQPVIISFIYSAVGIRCVPILVPSRVRSIVHAYVLAIVFAILQLRKIAHICLNLLTWFRTSSVVSISWSLIQTIWLLMWVGLLSTLNVASYRLSSVNGDRSPINRVVASFSGLLNVWWFQATV